MDNPVDGRGVYVAGTPLLAGVHINEGNSRIVDLLAGKRPAAARGEVPAQLPALLAPQDTADLPRHAPVVRQSRPEPPARGEPRGDHGRAAGFPAWGAGAYRGHGCGPPGLVHLAPAHLGRADPPVPPPATPASCTRRPRRLLEAVALRMEQQGIDGWFELDPGRAPGCRGCATTTRSWTPWMSGWTPGWSITASPAAGRRSAFPRISTWRVPTSIAAGSRAPC